MICVLLVSVVVIELAREGVFSMILYGDLVLISQIIEGVRNRFLKWKQEFWSSV